MTEKKGQLTIEKLKKYSGLENLTNQEAENVIATFEKFSNITFRMWLKEEKKRTESDEKLNN